MGLFDKLAGKKEISLTPHGALLLACITMITIDGNVDDDELAILKRIDRGKYELENALNVYKQKNIEECINIVANTLNEEQQVTCLANLIDIAMADGILAGAEKNLLEEYFNVFNVDSNIVEQIVNVIAVKNKEL